MINHDRASGVPDDGDPTVMQGSDWDADHVITDAAAVKTALGLSALATSGSTADLTGSLAESRITNLVSDLAALAASISAEAALARDAGNLSSGSIPAGRIANDTVTYAKMQNASATARILARVTAGAGDWEEATAAQILALLGIVAMLPVDCGSGIDGTATLDGTATVPWASKVGSVYTLLQPIAMQALTINVGSTLKNVGEPVRCRTPIVNNGTIDCSGGDAAGTVDGTGAITGTHTYPSALSSGTASSSAPSVFVASSAANGGASVGGAGSSGGPASASTRGRGGGSGGGGNNNPFTEQGAAGGSSPSVTILAVTQGDINALAIASALRNYLGTQFTLGTWGAPGAVGGSGTTGGGRGAPGGAIYIAAPGITGSGSIRAKGGAGGAGTAGAPTIGGASGGGGGAGGLIVTNLQGYANANTTDVTGGAAGAPGAGGAGGAGSGGVSSAGGDGYVLVL